MIHWRLYFTGKFILFNFLLDLWSLVLLEPKCDFFSLNIQSVPSKVPHFNNKKSYFVLYQIHFLCFSCLSNFILYGALFMGHPVLHPIQDHTNHGQKIIDLTRFNRLLLVTCHISNERKQISDQIYNSLFLSRGYL